MSRSIPPPSYPIVGTPNSDAQPEATTPNILLPEASGERSSQQSIALRHPDPPPVIPQSPASPPSASTTASDNGHVWTLLAAAVCVLTLVAVGWLLTH